MAKPDPSFKSKRYRDKLRQEIRDLENILPVERSSLHRRLDSQTIFRLSIAYFRTKLFLQDAIRRGCGIEKYSTLQENAVKAAAATNIEKSFDGIIQTDHLMQALDGFLMVLTSDGTMMYVSSNILQHLGFNQVDLMLRCIYGIVHPDDHEELKTILEGSLNPTALHHSNTDDCCTVENKDVRRRVSFLCRMKCFSGTTTGYIKMQCIGNMETFPEVPKSQRTTNELMFTFCRPFISVSTDSSLPERSGFWTKHELDLKFKQMDKNISEILGFSEKELEEITLYQIVHPEDLYVLQCCHKTIIYTEEIQTLYFRVENKEKTWMWLHTRGKLVFKNSKKYSIVFTHCPVREEDSTYIQQEIILRQKYAIEKLTKDDNRFTTPHFRPYASDSSISDIYEKHTFQPIVPEICTSSWHTSHDRHSPVFPSNTAQAIDRKRSRFPERPARTPESQRFEPGMMYSDPVMLQSGEASRYAPAIPSRLRRYHLRFDGIGISPTAITDQSYLHDLGQSQYSTMFIQGHVTAVEAAYASQNYAAPTETAYAHSNMFNAENVPMSQYTPQLSSSDCRFRYYSTGLQSKTNQKSSLSNCKSNEQRLSAGIQEKSDFSDIPGFVKIKQEYNPFAFHNGTEDFPSCRYASERTETLHEGNYCPPYLNENPGGHK